MYNRYIPQEDGTYKKNQMHEPQHNASRPPAPPPPQPAEQQRPEPCEPPQQIPPCKQEMGAGSFLRQLLPKNLDTGDLLIILLLLLMAGDCAEDKNTALLTLALYLFM